MKNVGAGFVYLIMAVMFLSFVYIINRACYNKTIQNTIPTNQENIFVDSTNIIINEHEYKRLILITGKFGQHESFLEHSPKCKKCLEMFD